MKQGRSIMELAAEIQRQSESKQDIVASTQRMKVYQNGDDLRLGVGDDYDYGINQTCHKQIANHTGIPAQYYDRMVREAPELLIEVHVAGGSGKRSAKMLLTLRQAAAVRKLVAYVPSMIANGKPVFGSL